MPISFFGKRFFCVSFLPAAVLLPIFALIARTVALDGMLPYEETLMRQARAVTPDTFYPVALVLHYLGKTAVAVPLVTFACACLCRLGRWREAVFCALSALLPTLNMLLLKAWLARPRPQLWTHLVEEGNFSFPSGHSTFSAAVAVMLTVCFRHTPYRRAVLSAGILFALLTGFSRIYLGVHYPSDVWAGWTNGLLCALTAYCIIMPSENRKTDTL